MNAHKCARLVSVSISVAPDRGGQYQQAAVLVSEKRE